MGWGYRRARPATRSPLPEALRKKRGPVNPDSVPFPPRHWNRGSRSVKLRSPLAPSPADELFIKPILPLNHKQVPELHISKQPMRCLDLLRASLWPGVGGMLFFFFKSQHLGDRGWRISVSSRPASLVYVVTGCIGKPCLGVGAGVRTILNPEPDSHLSAPHQGH